ncbi:RWD domain-containing protein 1 [Heterocephalus glaber]|uniref:RWD domain-containing protein 1 n=1 Tax=Heterocephalus glaber TaxID=10181 RepID=G5BWU0_HETGA|nr:RWD domain-containing protein 1 [Heterocephalus glaber]
MTDYSKEQRNELEALESIYPDSFTVLSENPPSFTITVTSEAGENDETVQTTLKFTYSEKYPYEPPPYEIFSQENLEDNGFLEDAGNNVEADESLFQELDDLELEDVKDDSDYNPAAPGSDSED